MGTEGKSFGPTKVGDGRAASRGRTTGVIPSSMRQISRWLASVGGRRKRFATGREDSCRRNSSGNLLREGQMGICTPGEMTGTMESATVVRRNSVVPLPWEFFHGHDPYSGSKTWRGTCGNGAVIASKARSGCTGAAVGRATPGPAGRRSAFGNHRRPGATTWASASRGQFPPRSLLGRARFCTAVAEPVA